MYDSSTPAPGDRASPTMGLRIRIMERRFRLATQLSRISGRSVEEALQVFRPLPFGDRLNARMITGTRLTPTGARG
jgi:hypothetical protein